eukprot:537248-Pleurochrysis_carterae.AAC.1
MLAICGSRGYIFFIDAAVIERFSQPGSLRTYLEEEVDLGAEAGGKLHSSILIGFGSKGIMAAVSAMALVCESALWMLLRAIGSDAHILDVLQTMWPMALAFFEQAAASPAAVIDGTLELFVESVREEKLTARARRTALDMARIRELAAGDAAVERLVSAAFFAMPTATRNHAAEFLLGGICAAEQITP